MWRYLMLGSLTAVFVIAQGAPPVPAGLWRNQEEGFVMRIEACGAGFCGFAAAAPKDRKREKQTDICGKQMLKDFVWNGKASRWEGKMQPPDTSMSLNAAVTSDGKSFFTMKARMLLVSKTMSFVPFTGKIGEGCRLEQEGK